MKTLAGKNVLLTGASGGLGVYITKALADAGVNLALVAFPGAGLEDLKAEVEKRGGRAIAMASDLRQADERLNVLEQVIRELGAIDVLINNAGVEFTAPYHELSVENIQSVIDVNLEAPMILTRLLLPEMLKRRSGKIIHMSSLAGKSSPAYQEPYAATKAALVAFTNSLRATYYGSGVSFSVICPGFVEAGIYARLKTNSGCAAPALLGTSPPERVAEAVMRALQSDVPEIIINPLPVRPLFALTALCPRLGAWITRKMGVHEFFRRAFEAQKVKSGSQSLKAPAPSL